jgi:hypothetical protein
MGDKAEERRATLSSFYLWLFEALRYPNGELKDDSHAATQ